MAKPIPSSKKKSSSNRLHLTPAIAHALIAEPETGQDVAKEARGIKPVAMRPFVMNMKLVTICLGHAHFFKQVNGLEIQSHKAHQICQSINAY